jgi:predicted DNA-binding transcriptional regulator YafY
LFFNIEIIDEAIESSKQIKYTYNKYGVDKKLHRTSTHAVSPYSMILHNQKYYLMGYHHGWGKVIFHRLDKITGMEITEKVALPIKSVEGYKNGIDYKEISTGLPYMFTDKPQPIEFIADKRFIDQIVDWFGRDIVIKSLNENQVRVEIKASVLAMEHWAKQYLGAVEITKPVELREKIKDSLIEAIEKYK